MAQGQPAYRRRPPSPRRRKGARGDRNSGLNAWSPPATSAPGRCAPALECRERGERTPALECRERGERTPARRRRERGYPNISRPARLQPPPSLPLLDDDRGWLYDEFIELQPPPSLPPLSSRGEGLGVRTPPLSTASRVCSASCGCVWA